MPYHTTPLCLLNRPNLLRIFARCTFLGVLALLNTASAQDCPGGCLDAAPPNCKYDGESRYTVSGCRVSITASWSGLSAPRQTASCLANPPRGYFLWSHTDHLESNNNGTYSVSRYSSGLDFHYEEEIDEAYSSALDLAAKIVDNKERQEVEGRLKAEWNQHKKTLQIIKTNADTIRLEASAEPHGWFADRKSGWIAVSVSQEVGCIAPANLKDQLIDKHKLRDELDKELLEISFVNRTSVRRFLAWRAADRFTKCADATGSTMFVTLDPNQPVILPLDFALSACFLTGGSISKPVPFDKACRV